MQSDHGTDEIELDTVTAAQRLGVHPETIRRAIRRGDLPARQVRRHGRATWLVTVADLAALHADEQTGSQPRQQDAPVAAIVAAHRSQLDHLAAVHGAEIDRLHAARDAEVARLADAHRLEVDRLATILAARDAEVARLADAADRRRWWRLW